MKKPLPIGIASAASLSAALLCFNVSQAHHSFAMFDQDKLVTVSGTIKEVEWTNPHSWFWITVMNESGQAEVWGFEAGTPETLARAGFKRSDIAIGAKVKVAMHPLKNGQKGGQLLTIELPDGRVAGSLKTPIDQLKDKGLLK